MVEIRSTTSQGFPLGVEKFLFTQYRRFRLSRTYPLDAIHSIYNSWIIHKQKNIYLFVSDTIIRDEFVNLGYERERLVVRPERTTKGIRPVKQRNNATVTLLSIGTLRPENGWIYVSMLWKRLVDLTSI